MLYLIVYGYLLPGIDVFTCSANNAHPALSSYYYYYCTAFASSSRSKQYKVQL